MIKTDPLIGSDFPYAKRPDTGIYLLVRRSEDQFWTVVHCKSYKEKIYIHKSSTDSRPND
ncbi:restriction endonuclease [Corynebacterium pyruviciproducens]|uniref:restriction endonuclease n=1 Tax=Corynebacterium pyruviciproducens TaxID=598660 RepID=UPI003B008044